MESKRPQPVCLGPAAERFGGGDDCDDIDPETYPGAPELCNNVDNNCNGTTDAVELRLGDHCDDPSFNGICGRDAQLACDGSRAVVCAPGAPLNPPDEPEASCNGLDDDCDGLVDDGATTGQGKTVGDTCTVTGPTAVGICASGSYVCQGGAV